MNSFLDRMDPDLMVPLIAIVMGCGLAMVIFICRMMGNVLCTRSVETTKRELAAYVAEGTLQPEQAVAILEAGGSGDDEVRSCCA